MCCISQRDPLRIILFNLQGFKKLCIVFLRCAVVAQLVEHHLAKVDVASSSLVNRSHAVSSKKHRPWLHARHGEVVEWLGSGLQSRVRGFKSRPHLADNIFILFMRDWRSGSALP